MMRACAGLGARARISGNVGSPVPSRGPAFLHFMFDATVAAVWRRSVLFR
jgi:hypothetical protein